MPEPPKPAPPYCLDGPDEAHSGFPPPPPPPVLSDPLTPLASGAGLGLGPKPPLPPPPVPPATSAAFPPHLLVPPPPPAKAVGVPLILVVAPAPPCLPVDPPTAQVVAPPPPPPESLGAGPDPGVGVAPFLPCAGLTGGTFPLPTDPLE